MQAEFSYSQIARVGVQGYPLGMELKVNIREIRKSKGMTLDDLASLIGVSTPHLSQVERGIKNLNNHLLVRTASALGVDPEDLISSENRSDLATLTMELERLDAADLDRVRGFVRALQLSQQGGERK